MENAENPDVAAYLGQPEVVTVNGDFRTNPFAAVQSKDEGRIFMPLVGEPEPFPWNANKVKFGFEMDRLGMVGREQKNYTIIIEQCSHEQQQQQITSRITGLKIGKEGGAEIGKEASA